MSQHSLVFSASSSGPVRGELLYISHRSKSPSGASASRRFVTGGHISLPLELTTENNFVLYELGLLNGSGKRSKVPINHLTGRKLSAWQSPENWLSYDEASQALERLSHSSFGLGYVMTKSDIVCVDIDHAKNPDGTYTAAALSLLEQIPGWVEVSTSGNLHIWTRASWPVGKTVLSEKNVEVFNSSGFVALTGNEYVGGRSIPPTRFNLEAVLTPQNAIEDRPRLDEFERYCLRDPKWTIEAARDFLMDTYPPTPRRSDWIEVGQILHFQFEGSEDAFVLWDEFSQRDGCGDYRGPADLQRQWQSFRLDHPNPKTFASLLAKVPRICEKVPITTLGSLRRVLVASGQEQADRYVLNQLIPEGIALIAGSPGVGKSTLMVELICRVAHLCPSDDPLRVKGRRKVIYLTEDAGQLRRLFNGKVRFGGLIAPPDEINEWVYVLETQKLTARELSGLIIEMSCTHQVVQTFGTREVVLPPLFVFDTASATFDIADENNNGEVSAFVAALKRGVALTGASVWIISHIAKAASKSDPKDITARGAGAWGGDVQVTFYITRDNGNRLNRPGFRGGWLVLIIRLLNIPADRVRIVPAGSKIKCNTLIRCCDEETIRTS